MLIEELLGSKSIICIEDLIDGLWNCKKNLSAYEAIKQVVWPIQLAPHKEGIRDSSVKHDATGRDMKKTTTRSSKGGYLGMMGGSLNEYVTKLI